jgi:hypothetical protein
MADAKSKEISVLSDEDSLSSIKSLDDAFKVLEAAGLVPVEVKELGTGFEVLENKSLLVGVPMLIMAMSFHSSEKFGTDGEFVTLHIVTEKGDKWIVNDGSTGIYAQAKRYSEKGIRSIICRKGLTQSDYKTEVPNAKTGELETINATTFYLSSV